jgi:hypothetical protein
MSQLLNTLKRWLKQAVTERIGLKLIAFSITVLLLTLVRFQEESERFFDVEVVPIMPEPVSGLAMTSGFPKTVRVRLAGPSSVINSLSPAEIPPIEVDLRGRRAGISHFYFSDDLFEESLRKRSKKMQFVRVIRTIPESVQIKMEKLVSWDVPVKINFDGKLQEGMEIVGESKVDPAQVVVIGPVSSMRGVRAVETDGVLVDGLGVGTHTQTVAAIPIDGVSIRGGEALTVSFEIRWIPGERILKKLPVEAQGGDFDVEFKPDKVNIGLAGPKVVLDSLDVSKIRPVVVIDEEKVVVPSVFQSEVTVAWVPDRVKVISIEPAEVRVSIVQTGSGKKRKERARQEKVKADE